MQLGVASETRIAVCWRHNQNIEVQRTALAVPDTTGQATGVVADRRVGNKVELVVRISRHFERLVDNVEAVAVKEGVGRIVGFDGRQDKLREFVLFILFLGSKRAIVGSVWVGAVHSVGRLLCVPEINKLSDVLIPVLQKVVGVSCERNTFLPRILTSLAW